MIRVGIIGGAGYVAGELIRILLHHPEAEIRFIASQSHAGEPVARIHRDLFHNPELRFEREPSSTDGLDVLFLCSGHGRSRETLERIDLQSDTVVIDLGNDFRLKGEHEIGDRTFVYGLPEVAREEIRQADSIASPGCFATLLQLGIVPLLKIDGLSGPIEVTAITGSTGAGVSPSETTHFFWRANNLSVYKPFTHQHLGEIRQTLAEFSEGDLPQINFVPMRGPFTRGIFAAIHVGFNGSIDTLLESFNERYTDEPFVQVTDEDPDLKQVVNTNHVLLNPSVVEGRALITGAIDNLTKGASGQAVQSMNIRFGLEETTGLDLKGVAF